jgi:hypothetical protein
MDLDTEASLRVNPTKVTPSPEFFQQHKEYISQDYDNQRIKAIHPQLHHHYHHPQSVTNNPGQPITGPYLSDHRLYHHYNHHNYNRKIPPLTLVPSQTHNVEYIEDQHRSPTKHAYDTVNYIVHRDNNNNYYHQLHQPHYQQVAKIYDVQESSNTAKNESQIFKHNSNSQYSKIVADHHQIVRRPSAVLINQMVDMPLHVSHSIPIHESTTPSQKVIYTKTKLQNMKIQSPQQSHMMIMQGKFQIPTSTYFQTIIKRPLSTISSIAPNPDQKIGGPNYLTSSIKTPSFYERKQVIHKTPMLSRIYSLGMYPHHQQYQYNKPTKLTKVDIIQSQRANIETKVTPSNLLSEDKTNILKSTIMKQTRNTGFDPKSIVIEKGFKPILMKNSNKTNNLDKQLRLIQDNVVKESMINNHNDSFEPVFIPSPPDQSIVKKPIKNKVQLIKRKFNDINDMEMAVINNEHLDYTFLYLPTTSSTVRFTKTKNTNLDSAFLLDPNTNTTFPLDNGNQKNLLETNYTSLQNRSKTYKSSLNLKPSLVGRKKRFIHNDMRKKKPSDIIHERDYDFHDHQDNANYPINRNNSINNYYSQHQENYNNEDKQYTDNLNLASTGKIIFANIQYIILTVILYYVL